MADALANLAIGTVVTAPAPATSGSTLTLTTGHGARMPAAPFNATVWAAGALPDPTNAEIVRVTARAGDVLTIARTQESTTARAIGAGDLLAQTITARTLNQIYDQLGTAPTMSAVLAPGTVYYLAHRGEGDVYPEHTWAAYRQSAANPAVSVVEISTQNTKDGHLVCFHDLTLDRTSTLTGAVNAKVWAELGAGTPVDYGSQVLGVGWPNQPIPLYSEVCAALAGRVVTIVENKNGSTSNMLKILGMWAKSGPKDQFVYKFFREAAGGIPAHAATVKAAGYKTWAYFSGGESAAVVDATAAQADILGVVSTMSDAEITYVVSKGLPVIVYEVHRRHELARFTALGVKGMMCSGTTYVSATSALATASDFASGVRWPGDLNGSESQQPTWDPANRAVILPPAVTSSLLLGSMSPVAGAAGTYTITLAMRWAALPGDLTTHGDFIFGHADDVRYTHQSTSNTGGYHVVMRANGQLQLFRHDPGSGTGTQLGLTQATSAAVAGAWITLSIVVTPTSITLQRTDEVTTPITTTNTQYRGGYLHLAAGSSATAVAFRDVVVS